MSEQFGPTPEDSIEIESSNTQRERYQWRDGLPRVELGIDYHLQEILNAWEANQVVLVQAETGVGKTTRIPQALADQNPQAKIHMTQTRRVAARRNGRRICQELQSRPGEKAGWRMRGESVGSKDTPIILTMDRSLLNQIRRREQLPSGTIIIDEAHERTIPIDVLMGVCRQYLPNSPETKLIITSATLDTEKFHGFFADPENGDELQVAEPIRIFNEQKFAVEVAPRVLGRGEHHTQGAIAAIKEQMVKFAQGQLTIPAKEPDGDRQVVTQGTLGALVPGKEDINQVLRECQRFAQEQGIADKFEFIQAHGQMTPEDDEKLGQDASSGKLRILAATEVLRSSVTVPDMVAVVDSLQVKRKFVDNRGVGHLGKVTVSGAEADQAKGRVGRVNTGLYIPITFENEYQRITRNRANNPEYWPQSAMERGAGDAVVLEIAALGFDIRDLPLLAKPSPEAIQVSIDRLKKFGALDEDEKITAKGRLLAELPFETQRGMVLIEADKRGVLEEALIVSAIVEQDGIRWVPKTTDKMYAADEAELLEIINSRRIAEGKRALEALPDTLPEFITPHKNGSFEIDCGYDKYVLSHEEVPSFFRQARDVATYKWRQFAQESNSDFVAMIHAYRQYRQVPFKERRQWCLQRSLNYKSLQMVDTLLGTIENDLSETPLKISGNVATEREFDNNQLTKALIAGGVDSIARYDRNLGRYRGPKADNIILSDSSACRIRPIYCLMEGVRKQETQGRRGRSETRYYSDAVVAVTPEMIMEVVPQLCEDTFKDGTQIDWEKRQLIGMATTVFSGVELQTQVKAAKGSLFREEVISIITGNRAEQTFADQPEFEFLVTNNHRVQRASELMFRDLRRDFQLDDQYQAWYQEQLKTLKVSSLDDLVKYQSALTVTEELLSTWVGEDFSAYEARITAEKPDSIEIHGKTTYLDYNYGSTVSRRLTVTVDIEVVDQLNWEDFPKYEGFNNIQVQVNSENLPNFYTPSAESWTPDTIHTFKLEAEMKRREAVWKTFIDQHVTNESGAPVEPLQLRFDAELPHVPETEIWDEQTGAIAYPAYTSDQEPRPSYSDTQVADLTVKLAWYKTAREALQAEIDLATQRQIVADWHRHQTPEEATQFVQTEIDRVLSMAAPVLDDPGAYGLDRSKISHRSLFDDLNDMPRQVRRYRTYDDFDGYVYYQACYAFRMLEANVARIIDEMEYKTEQAGLGRKVDHETSMEETAYSSGTKYVLELVESDGSLQVPVKMSTRHDAKLRTYDMVEADTAEVQVSISTQNQSFRTLFGSSGSEDRNSVKVVVKTTIEAGMLSEAQQRQICQLIDRAIRKQKDLEPEAVYDKLLLDTSEDLLGRLAADFEKFNSDGQTKELEVTLASPTGNKASAPISSRVPPKTTPSVAPVPSLQGDESFGERYQRLRNLSARPLFDDTEDEADEQPSSMPVVPGSSPLPPPRNLNQTLSRGVTTPPVSPNTEFSQDFTGFTSANVRPDNPSEKARIDWLREWQEKTQSPEGRDEIAATFETQNSRDKRLILANLARTPEGIEFILENNLADHLEWQHVSKLVSKAGEIGVQDREDLFDIVEEVSQTTAAVQAEPSMVQPGVWDEFSEWFGAGDEQERASAYNRLIQLINQELKETQQAVVSKDRMSALILQVVEGAES